MAGEPSPDQAALKWAWARTGDRFRGFLVGGLGFGFAAGLGQAVIGVPESPSLLERAIPVCGGSAVGLLVAVPVAFLWSLVRAPYEQRDALLRERVDQPGRPDAELRRVHLESVSEFRQKWAAIAAEVDGVINRRGSDPEMAAFVEKVFDTWAAMRQRIHDGSLPALGPPFDHDMSKAQILKLRRTSFRSMVQAGIDNLDHLAATLK